MGALTLFDPEGAAVANDANGVGEYPTSYLASVGPPAKGTWTALFEKEGQATACTQFQVRKTGTRRLQPNPDGGIWKGRRAWGRAYEDLFSAFVERLFDYPLDGQKQTWTSLHELLRDADHNILHDYLGYNEEAELELVPDCADLPYTLRAYFAWKLDLPFGMHSCKRARRRRAPTCEPGPTNLHLRTELEAEDAVQAFAKFAKDPLRRTVHSSSGRTSPKDEASDFYPIPLSRDALRPGTLFTDPYGHLLVIAQWVPQTSSTPGALIGADAQPDGTIGRRRFWRGSFLFHPDTKSGAAGFKAFRPYKRESIPPDLAAGVAIPTTPVPVSPETAEPTDDVVEETPIWSQLDGKHVVPVENKRLRRRPTPLSREQYRDSENAFYDKVESLINPEPLDPKEKLLSLIGALEEQVLRRKNSVENGEAFMLGRAFAPIEMPKGAAIFLTSGPWEEYSTPSRDWRLQVAMHTVLDFPDAIRRTPTQYGFSAGEAETRATSFAAFMKTELSKRTFAYKRSDGSNHSISLWDVLSRRQDLEMAYNPNDCIEVRWAAPKGSAEFSTCSRRAPDAQFKRMEEYRHWFSERRRPP